MTYASNLAPARRAYWLGLFQYFGNLYLGSFQEVSAFAQTYRVRMAGRVSAAAKEQPQRLSARTTEDAVSFFRKNLSNDLVPIDPDNISNKD